MTAGRPAGIKGSMCALDRDGADPAGGLQRDAAAEHMERLTDEVHELTVVTPDFGRAVGRMYEIFRLTGRHAEAAYVSASIDELILWAIAARGDRASAEATLPRPESIDQQLGPVDETRAGVVGPAGPLPATARLAVSNYFERVLIAVPSIRAYLASVAGTGADMGSAGKPPARR
jgi:hypothetical protein